ncbi:MAG: hypothetical protein ACI8WY_001234 [Planctomycetota bacterium]|jgi:hypothetical protein
MTLIQIRRAVAATAALAASLTGAQAQVLFGALSDQPTPSSNWIFLASCPGGSDVGGQVLASFNSAETLVWNGCGFTVVPDAPKGINLPFAMASDPLTGAASALGSTLDDATFVASNFDGASWSRPIDVDPTPRFGHTAIAMPSIGETVVYGGIDPVANVVVGDLITWNGALATPQVLAGAPSDRFYHAMSFDSSTGSVMMHGGFDNAGGLLADTWLLSPQPSGGLAWQQLTLPASPALESHGMAFDAARGVHVMYGGRTTGNAANALLFELDLNAVSPAWTMVTAAEGTAGSGKSVIWQNAGSDHLMIAGTNAAATSFRAEFGIQTGSSLATPLIRTADCQQAFFDLAAPGQCAQLGTNVTITPSGLAPGAFFALFSDFASTFTPGTCILSLTSAAQPVPTTFALPTSSVFVGLDLFFQGVTVDSGGAVQTSDVCQFRLGN